MEIEIRSEETRDLEQVRKVLCAAFPSEAESKLVDSLRANGKALISLVAVREDEVLGHILFSPVSIVPAGGTAPSGEPNGMGLAPVAVRPDAQSQRIGSGLILEGLRHCKKLGYDYCVVLGNPEYYGRFGFEKASRFGMENEYGVDDEFMMIRFSQRDPAPGLVKYAPEFAMFSV